MPSAVMVRPTAVGKFKANRFFLAIVFLAVLGLTSCEGDSELRVKERVLRNDLFALREQIKAYTLDKKRAPQSLQDLVAAGYLTRIPKDPFTGSDKTWITVKEPTVGNNGRIETGVNDVHSGSNLISSDGTPYASW
jgi:general secretion pathway protein G